MSGQDSKKKSPSFILESACDYHLCFWHASFGYAGSLNDLNVFNLPPLLDSLVDGTFHQNDIESHFSPYIIDGEAFVFLFLLV